MVKMKALSKNATREIGGSLGRYLAIFTIIALGAGLFIGLRLSRPDFLETFQQYMDETHFYNFRLVSTLGLTADDVREVMKLDGVTGAEGAVTADFLYKNENGDNLIITANSIGKSINLIDVVAGRMPSAPGECLADPNMFGEDDIGKTIRLSEDNSEETFDSFACTEYTVVGIAESVCYINRERGTSTLGNGSVEGYVYILPEGFTLDCFTDIYVTVDAEGYVYSVEYDESADRYVKPLEAFMEERAVIRHDSIIDDATEELRKASEQYEEGLAEYQSGWAEYEKGRDEFNEKKLETEAELKAAYDQIASVDVSELDRNETELLAAQREIARGYSEYESGLRQLERQSGVQYSLVNSRIDRLANSLNNNTAELEEIYAKLSEIDAELETAGALRRAALQTERAAVGTRLDICKRSIENNREDLQDALNSKAELDARFLPYRQQLEDGKRELDENSASVEDGLRQIRDAKAQLEYGRKAYEEGKAEAERGFAEAEQELNAAKYELDLAAAELEDAREKLEDAEREIKNIKHADTYVLGRETNIGYVCFESDTEVVDSVAGVFPVFFLLVAALVCMTTMTRMVSDERTQVGIMKALGYGSGAIIGKYLFYSGTATLLGCVFGIGAGSYVFPFIVWVGYGIMYSFSELVFTMNWSLAAMIAGINIAAMLLVTWYCCRRELRSVAAELIRPKAPESGKRILLERLTVLWNRLSFMQKVSVRNVFRYKMRIFMMLLGIGGCTALVLTAFGLNDTIKNVVDFQYGEISLYDYELSLAYNMDDAEKELFLSSCGDNAEDLIFLYRTNADLKTADKAKSVTLTATDESDLSEYIDLHDGDEPIAYPGLNEVIINRNIAMLMGISVGDEIEISNADLEALTLTVTGIFDNYVSNHAFVTLETCREQWGYSPEIKSALINAPEGADIHKTAAEIAKTDGVRSISLCADTGEMIGNMMESLNYVVLLIILCAGLLAFIVLYNITNINISERIREIATIKVLGFYPNEAASYVFRENLALTGAGALFGLALGVLLHSFVMHRIKVDLLYFEPSINLISYVLAIVMTYVFAVIVNAIMRKKIDNIDMAGALKSIE